MHKKSLPYTVAGLLALATSLQPASARLYDSFNSSANWTLTGGGGTSVIANSQLTLTSPANALSTPSATAISTQQLTGSRQSILVRDHVGVANSTVFFFWAIASSGNMLELKLDDVNPTTVVAGYYSGGTYHYVGSASYNPGGDGLYLAFYESGGTTHWQISTDASTWTDVASDADPINEGSVTFEMQHKAYNDTSGSTFTIVDCFNYKLHGVGYHSLEDKTYTGSDGWELYTEGFSGGQRVCCNSGCTACVMTVNGVDSTQHFTDTSIPAPYTNQQGYDFQITSTQEPTTHWYYNAYRYQNLAYVDADVWTYHLYFKYSYPQYIVQGLEFPLNKYDGSYRLQGAVAWYPLRDGTDNGEWNVWTGTTWKPTGNYQKLQTNWWYEVTFTVGLHDGQVSYNGFSAGTVGSLSNFAWSATYGGTGDTSAARVVPAMQMDDNVQDTTTANTRKDCYMAEWHIDWMDERLP